VNRNDESVLGVSGRLGLGVAYAVLSEADQDSFWRFAARGAVSGRIPKGVPRANGNSYDGLCAAVEDLARKGGSKSRPSNLPRIVRRLSTDDLSRAVLRLRSRLLGHEYAEPALSDYFCNWVRSAKRVALVAALKALGCDCDDTGVLLGSVKHRDGELARRQLVALAQAHGAYELAVVCTGLMTNHEQWSFLWQACEHLVNVAHKPQTATPAEQAPPTTEVGAEKSGAPSATFTGADQEEPEPAASERSQHTVPCVMPAAAGQFDLPRLRADASSLARLLQQAADEMERGRIAPPDKATALWVQLHQQLLLACAALGLDNNQSIADLEEAAAKNEGQAQRESVAAAITRLQRLTNSEDARASYLIEVQTQTAAVVANLKHGELDVADELVRSALALVGLVERHAGLSSQEAFELFAEASRGFGLEVAHAATRGSLRFDTAPLEPALTLETDGARAALEPPTGPSPAPPLEVVPAPEEPSPADVAITSEEAEQSSYASEPTPIVPVVSSIGAPAEFEPVATSEMHEPALSRQTGEAPSAEPLGIRATHVPRDEPTPRLRQIALEPCSFDTFITRYWIDGEGKVVPAPWLSDDFSARLGERAQTAWASGQYGLASLFAKAARLRGGDVGLDEDELIAAAKLVSQPDDFLLVRNDRRLTVIRSSVSNHAGGTAALSLTLEALAPTLPIQLFLQEVEQLVAAACFSTPMLAEVVGFLLAGWVAATDPVQLLRTALESASAADPAVLQTQLQNSQRKLQEVVATLYSAAGGRIQRTHCRKAWTEFVLKHVGPLRAELAPLPTEKSQSHHTSKDVGTRVVELGRAFQRIMATSGVKHQDLAVAVSAAEQIVSAVQDVVDAKAQIEQAAKRSPVGSPVPVESLRKLMTDLPSHENDRLSTILLRARISRQTQQNPLLLPTGLLVRCPALLGTLSPAWLASPSLMDGLPMDAFSDHVAAAALLLEVDVCEVTEGGSEGQLLTVLRDAVVDAGRIELLGTLASTTLLQPHERSQLHRHAIEVGDDTYNQARRLERAWLACDELVHANTAQFRTIASAALERCTAEPSPSASLEPLLLASWVAQQVQVAEAARDEIVRIRIDQAAKRSPELAREVELHLSAHRYQAAMAMLDPNLPIPEPVTGPARRTMWRNEGLERFRRPSFALEHELRSPNAVVTVLARAWAGTSGDPNHPDKDVIRKTFYEVVSGEAGLSQEVKRNRLVVRLQDLRDHQPKKTVIRCAALREYFKRAKLNPSFLPQLHDYQQLVLLHSGLHRAGNLVDIISKDTEQEMAGTLCVFLEPGVPLAKRDDVTAALRRRGVNAVLIDDVDLCRLSAIQDDVEGHNFIPFLEIVFEQLDLEIASPFSSLDGQHVRIETFVGRVQQANMVAMTSRYTRLFSGRKLGKSAFLRHVAHSFDGEKTSSKNTLNVIFITIAGGESENWVVDCIIKEMNKRFDLPMESDDARRLSPADRYTAYARRFGDYKPMDNVLLILDEADAFVDGQLKAYDRDNREGSLSFRMMKESSAGVDSAQMPRIRILFSGYRVTNTRGGVWANAGDVLILQPLTEDEATDFLRGMLGRIGVDIGAHARFAARRCGYQPAVLIRFGETLLRRLKRNSRSGKRETLIVSYDDVQATMAEQPVVDEIRTVVSNNFQGNREAATIFAATLLALKDLQPGMSLDDGPSQVLGKIAEIDADLDWLKRFGPHPLAQIERQLQEFIDRELLSVTDSTRFGAREYRLKFPHFLPVLTQHTDLPNEIRLHIQHLRAGAGSNRLIESVLPDASLDAVRYWHQQDTAGECAFVVVGGQWVDALVNEKIGVPDRLGTNKTHVVDANSDVDCGAMVKRGQRVFKDVSAQGWEQVSQSTPSRPLTLLGGVDLVRAARLHSLYGRDDGKPLEIIGLGRLSEATVAWWFEVARALHFKSPDAPARIYEATAGIPLLVAAVDRLFPHSPSADVTAAELQSALTKLEGEMPSIARDLKGGTGPVGLSTRELELLKMVFLVGSELEAEFDLGQDFPLLWEIVADASRETIRPPLTDTEDQVALQILIDAGLIEVSSKAATRSGSTLGRVHLSIGDPVRKLLSALESIGEG
jgi:hypothetical protein